MGKSVINEGPLPRFVAGKFIPVGEPFDPDALDSEAFATASTPIGQLNLAQLEAEIARRRGSGADDVTRKLEAEAMRNSTGEDATNFDVALAPTHPTSAPPVGDVDLDKIDRATPGESRPQLDRDKDGAAGGSRSKAEIAAELTELGIEFDGRASRDDLAKLLPK